jgi:hypothetical protein
LPGRPIVREWSRSTSDRRPACRTFNWDAAIADDALWEKLHQHFTVPELVELGSFVALTLGQQRWIKTLGIGHREVLADSTEGLATGVAGADGP